MSQNAAGHGPRAKSEEDEDVAVPGARQPGRGQRVRPGRPAGQPDDGGLGPDDPEDGEFELIGGDDLGAADLGPARPGSTDPDAGSGRARKIT